MTGWLLRAWMMLLIASVVLVGACTGPSSLNRPPATGAYLRLDFVVREGAVQLSDVWRFDMPGGRVTERAGGSVIASVRVGGTIRETHYLDFSGNGRIEGSEGGKQYGYPTGGAGQFDSLVIEARDDSAVDLRFADASTITVDAARLSRARSLDGALARSIPHIRLLRPDDIGTELDKMVSSEFGTLKLRDPEDAYLAFTLSRELARLTPATRGALRTLGLFSVVGAPVRPGLRALSYGTMLIVDENLPPGVLAHGAAHALASAREAAPLLGSSFEDVWLRLQGASAHGYYESVLGASRPDSQIDSLERGFADPYGDRTVVEDIATHAELQVASPTTQRLCDAFRTSPTLLPSLAANYVKFRLLELEGYVTREAISGCTNDPPVAPGAGIRAYRRDGAVEEFTMDPRVSRSAGNDEERFTMQATGARGRAQLSFARALTGPPLTILRDGDGLKVPDSPLASGRILFLESVAADAAKGFLVGSYAGEIPVPLVTFDVQGPPVQ